MQGYNCNNSNDSSYGASAYGTCSTVLQPPNTGFFQPLFSSGSFSIIAPIAVAVLLTAIATIVIRRKKARQQ